MGKLINKKAIMVGNCDGFVGNRMIAPYAGEAKMVLEEGGLLKASTRKLPEQCSLHRGSGSLPQVPASSRWTPPPRSSVTRLQDEPCGSGP